MTQTMRQDDASDDTEVYLRKKFEEESIFSQEK